MNFIVNARMIICINKFRKKFANDRIEWPPFCVFVCSVCSYFENIYKIYKNASSVGMDFRRVDKFIMTRRKELRTIFSKLIKETAIKPLLPPSPPLHIPLTSRLPVRSLINRHPPIDRS